MKNTQALEVEAIPLRNSVSSAKAFWNEGEANKAQRVVQRMKHGAAMALASMGLL